MIKYGMLLPISSGRRLAPVGVLQTTLLCLPGLSWADGGISSVGAIAIVFQLATGVGGFITCLLLGVAIMDRRQVGATNTGQKVMIALAVVFLPFGLVFWLAPDNTGFNWVAGLPSVVVALLLGVYASPYARGNKAPVSDKAGSKATESNTAVK